MFYLDPVSHHSSLHAAELAIISKFKHNVPDAKTLQPVKKKYYENIDKNE
jgi:hypothetical protein